MTKSFWQAGHTPDADRRLPLFRPRLHGLGAARAAGADHRQGPRPDAGAEGPDGRGADAGRRGAAAGQRPAGRPHRAQAHRRDQPADRHRRPARRLAASGSTASPARWRSASILGFAGASFAVALPLASRWYPPEHQGKAMGIAGMGNSGTVLRRAVRADPGQAVRLERGARPRRASRSRSCFVVYMVAGQGRPDAARAQAARRLSRAAQGQADAWWFMLFYGVTFGGFVGLAASLSIYFTDQFGADPGHRRLLHRGLRVRRLAGAPDRRRAGRPDRRHQDADRRLHRRRADAGGDQHRAADARRWRSALFVLAMLALGAGNGAVFQLVPQRFRKEIGVMTGLVGFAGGVGGFYLASSLGFAKQLTGSSAAGLPDLRRPGAGRAGRAHRGQGPLAHDLGRGAAGRAHLSGADGGRPVFLTLSLCCTAIYACRNGMKSKLYAAISGPGSPNEGRSRLSPARTNHHSVAMAPPVSPFGV